VCSSNNPVSASRWVYPSCVQRFSINLWCVHPWVVLFAYLPYHHPSQIHLKIHSFTRPEFSIPQATRSSATCLVKALRWRWIFLAPARSQSRGPIIWYQSHLARFDYIPTLFSLKFVCRSAGPSTSLLCVVVCRRRNNFLGIFVLFLVRWLSAWNHHCWVLGGWRRRV